MIDKRNVHKTRLKTCFCYCTWNGNTIWIKSGPHCVFWPQTAHLDRKVSFDWHVKWPIIILSFYICYIDMNRFVNKNSQMKNLMEEVELKDELYTIIVFLVLSISSISFLAAMKMSICKCTYWLEEWGQGNMFAYTRCNFGTLLLWACNMRRKCRTGKSAFISYLK